MQVYFILSGLGLLLVALFDFLSQLPHNFRHSVLLMALDSLDSHISGIIAVTVTECDEVVLASLLRVAKNKGELAATCRLHVNPNAHLTRLAGDNRGAVAIDGAIPVGVHVRSYIVAQETPGIGDGEVEFRIMEGIVL